MYNKYLLFGTYIKVILKYKWLKATIKTKEAV